MESDNLRICIVDDERAYFTPEMIAIAEKAGFSNIERYLKVDKELLKSLLEDPPNIIILDI